MDTENGDIVPGPNPDSADAWKRIDARIRLLQQADSPLDIPLEQTNDVQEAFKAIAAKEAGRSPDPEKSYSDLDAKLKSDEPGNHQDNFNELLKVTQAKDAAQDDFNRKMIALARATTQQIIINTSVLDQLIRAFEQSRESY